MLLLGFTIASIPVNREIAQFVSRRTDGQTDGTIYLNPAAYT